MFARLPLTTCKLTDTGSNLSGRHSYRPLSEDSTRSSVTAYSSRETGEVVDVTCHAEDSGEPSKYLSNERKERKKKLEKRRKKFVGCLHIWFLAHIHSQGQTAKGCTFFPYCLVSEWYLNSKLPLVLT